MTTALSTIAPTATISNITGTTPCIEPAYKNLFVKSNLSGEFIILNAELVGHWGISFAWSDGHGTGIFPFDSLREWCDQRATENEAG